MMTTRSRKFLIFNILVVVAHLPLVMWLIADSARNDVLLDNGRGFMILAVAIPTAYLIIAYGAYWTLPNWTQENPSIKKILAAISFTALLSVCYLEGMT